MLSSAGSAGILPASSSGHTAARPYSVLTRLALFLALLPCSAVAQTTSAPPPTDRSTLVGLESGQLSEADLEEGVTILVVWATWSPRCRGAVRRIEALAASWAPTARVASVVFQEEPETVRRFLDVLELDGQEATVPVFIDVSGAFSKKYSVTTLPFLLIFDRGKTAYRGKLPADPDPVVERALAAD